jgi:hypothetical protein
MHLANKSRLMERCRSSSFLRSRSSVWAWS